MKRLLKPTILCLSLIVLTLNFLIAEEKPLTPLKYPETKKVSHVDSYTVNVEDPYRWLEDSNSPETAKWVETQQKFTEQYFAGIEYRAAIKNRLTELWNFEKYSMPFKAGEYYFFTKNNGLQEQFVLYFQKGLNGKPEMLLDPNTFSKDSSVTLDDIQVTHDAKYLAYSVSRSGSDWREIFVLDLKSKKKLTDHIEWVKFSNLAWHKDGFYYSRYDKSEESEKLKAKLENHKIYYHKVNTPQSSDKLIFQDTKNPLTLFYASVSDNDKYLIITGDEGSSDFNFLYYKNLETDSAITPIIDKPIGHFNFVEEDEGKFLVYTDYEAPNYKLIRIDPKNPQKENWAVVIPESQDKLRDISVVGGKLIASYFKDANTTITAFDLDGKKLHDIDLPGIGSVGGFSGRKSENEVFYGFTSFTTPSTYYLYNIKENKSELFRKSKVKFDPDKFEAKEVFYESKDKTRVPLFIVYKKGVQLNGLNPTLLYAYGGFNVPMTPAFRMSIVPFLEAGGVYAMACLRGGGEYGEKWHKAGMLEKKQNVFDDFIAAAEYLIQTGYTSPAKLAIWGGSNGGLLIGAVINQRPELFNVAIPEVGVMDMLRYQKFTIGWAWVGEYGSSENPSQFSFLYAYSPLHNIKEGLHYPATLITTADHDDRVFPAHSFKYAATLQEKYKGENPILIRIETKAGHGTGGGTSKQIESIADIYCFIFSNMKITPVFK